MKKAIICVLYLSVFGFLVNSLNASTLWNNGDESWGSGVSNEINTQVSDSRIYDDFFVPVGDGSWIVNEVWSYNYSSYNLLGIGASWTPTTQAHWEIRSDVSGGAPGTLIASGDSGATETFSSSYHPNDSWLNNSYKISVSGLNISLNPGQYWLSVTPIGYGSVQAQFFIQGTSGTNSIGAVGGNDGNAYWDSTYWKRDFELRPNNQDYSMGIAGEKVQGNAVPEPATMLLFGLGLLGLAGVNRRKK